MNKWIYDLIFSINFDFNYNLLFIFSIFLMRLATLTYSDPYFEPICGISDYNFCFYAFVLLYILYAWDLDSAYLACALASPIKK